MQHKIAFYRSFLGYGTPARWPSCNRVVETLCIKLCAMHPSPKKKGADYTPRWHLILQKYNAIRSMLLNNQKVLDQTNLVLPNVNQTTLTQW